MKDLWNGFNYPIHNDAKLNSQVDKELRDTGSQNLEANPSSMMADGENGNEHPQRSGTNL